MGDPADRLVTDPTQSRDVNVTNNADSDGNVKVIVYDDANGDGKRDANEPIISSTIIEPSESGTIGVPAGKECDVTIVRASDAASGSWTYLEGGA